MRCAQLVAGSNEPYFYGRDAGIRTYNKSVFVDSDCALSLVEYNPSTTICELGMVKVRKIIPEHLHYLRSVNYRPSSIYARELFLNRFANYFPGIRLCRFTKVECDEFLDRHDISARGRNSEVNHLKGFFTWCTNEQIIDLNPTDRLHKSKTHRSLPRPIPDNDLSVALSMSQGRVRAWLYLAAYAGLRACEIAQIHSDDIEWGRDTLIIREQKGGSMGQVPIAPIVKDILETLPSEGYLFPSLNNQGRPDGSGEPVKPHRVQALSNRFLHSIGIDSTFHSLRHWYGTNCYRQTKDLRLTQELMRHNSPESTAIYTAVDNSEAQKVVSMLPKLQD